jgi:hypothetical protein
VFLYLRSAYLSLLSLDINKAQRLASKNFVVSFDGTVFVKLRNYVYALRSSYVFHLPVHEVENSMSPLIS